METSISKSLIRKVALDYRRLLDQGSFEFRNDLLCEKVLDVVQANGYKCLHVFMPMKRNREPDMTPLFDQLRESGTRIATSRTDFQNKSLSHFYLEKDTQLKMNSMGIPEPIEAEPAKFEDVDLVLVPLALADKHGNRIGYGGGFYDRLLKESEAQTIGITLAPLLDEIAQKEAWDIPLNTIITPFDGKQ